MFAEEIRRAVQACQRGRLPELSAAVWKGFAAGAVSEDEAQHLAELIEARRAMPEAPATPRRPVGSRPRSSASKYRARKGRLSELKAALAARMEERERIDTFATEYRQLVETRDRARTRYEEALGERGSTQSRIEEIQRHLTALPRLATLCGIRETLQGLSDLPDAPFGWSTDLPILQAEAIELSTRAEGFEGEVANISDEIANMVVDEVALFHAERVERLVDLRARYLNAEKDIPERRLQLGAVELAIVAVLARLARADEVDPSSLLLDAVTTGALRDLVESRSGIDAAVHMSAGEVADARLRLSDAEAVVDGVGGAIDVDLMSDLAILAAATAAARAGNHVAKRRTAERLVETRREAWLGRLASLRPWAGDRDDLLDPGFPEPADLERWKAGLTEARRRIDRQEGEIDRLDAERLRLEAELDAIEAVAGSISDAEAAGVRAVREEAWADHRRALDAGSASTFERALRRDDLIADARLRNEGEVGRHRQASKSLVILRVDLVRARVTLAESRRADDKVLEEIADALQRTMPSLPADMSIDHLEAWLEKRGKAIEALVFLRQAEIDMREVDGQELDARQAVARALRQVGSQVADGKDLDALLGTAMVVLDMQRGFETLREAAEAARREVKAREHSYDKAVGAERLWLTSWTRVCSTCWLGRGDAMPDVAEVRDILPVLAELGPALDRKVGLAEQLRKLSVDQDLFQGEVNGIASGMNLDPKANPLEVARQASERIRLAQIASSTMANRTKALASARERMRELDGTREVHRRRSAEMTAYFGVETLAEVGAKLQAAVWKDELRGRAEVAEREMLDALRVGTVDDAVSALDDADRGHLEAELGAARSRLEDQDQRLRDLFTTHSKAFDRVEAVGGDDAAARIEERRRTTQLEIEEGAMRYLKLRTGVAAAEIALRTYRDKHRSSMMARASDAFRTISRGAYVKLATQPNKDVEVLVAMEAGGGSKVASELSKGTRFQLYLALRVAGYLEYVQARPPLPFLADDIMETFDDFRAEEAFRLLADMAGVGQVVYLTHHRHLCDIARAVCPEVRVHELPP